MTQSHTRITIARTRITLLALVVGLSAMLSPIGLVEARPTQPSGEHRRIALVVAKLIQGQHLSRHALDDEISRRCMETFLKSLDPKKLYFYQSDIDRLTANRNELDDMFRRGDINFAYDAFNVFLTRVDERIATALTYLDQPHDFTVDEEMVIEYDAATYAKTPEEAADRWRKRVKFDLLRKITEDTEMDEAVEQLRKRYSHLGKSWAQTDDDELLERYLSAMTSGFDPHSSYMSASTLKNFQIVMSLKLEGIGASLRSEDGYTEVHEIIPGGAADEDGRLKKGDRIIGVGQGVDGNMADIVDMKLNDVVKKIRGDRGTIVRLEINPVENPTARVVYDITRDEIELKNQEARSEIIEHGQKPDGTPYRMGVIHLPSFYMDMEGARLGLPGYKSTTADVRRLLDQFNRDSVDVVVMDLRFNGGGSLTESVNMTGLFIDRGPVVQVKGTNGQTQKYDDREEGMVWSGPLVVMINKFSASASEIFAGAVQDYGRGIVVGDHATHGKGTVQQLFDVGNLLFQFTDQKEWGALKMTIQQFYRPSGDSTQNRGVMADIELPSLFTHLEIGEADLDYAMDFDQVVPLDHQNYHMVNPQIVADLRKLAGERVAKSEYFNKENRRIARFEAQKSRETVTLNREKYEAEMAELDVEKEEEETLEQQSDTNRPVFELDEYGTEALDVTADYLRLLGANQVATSNNATRAVQRVP
jgi:carboxyl-terminal processing protease